MLQLKHEKQKGYSQRIEEKGTGAVVAMSKKESKEIQPYEAFLNQERKNIRLSMKHYDKEFAIYIECFNLLDETIQDTCQELKKDKPVFDEFDVAFFFNCARVLGSLKVYTDLMMEGHYYDANIVCRSLLENFFLMKCFIENKKNVKKWLDGELKLGRIKKELGLYYDEVIGKFYEGLCDFVHVNIPAVLTLVEIHKEDPSIDIYLRPKFSLDSQTGLKIFPIFGFLVLALLLEHYGDIMKKRTKTKVERALKKWKVEAGKLCDKADKERKKQESR